MPFPGDYSTLRTAALSGLSVQMLAYLCRTGIAEPSANTSGRGRGKRRRYTFNDLVFLRVIAVLLSNGVSVARVRRAIDALRQEQGITGAESPAITSRYLVTDGKDVFRITESGALETLDETRQFAFMFVLDCQQIKSALVKQIKELAAA